MASSNNTQSSLPILPDDVLIIIFSNLDIKGKCSSAQVCIQWWNVMHNAKLWRDHTVELYLDNELSIVLPSLNARGVSILQLTTRPDKDVPPPTRGRRVDNLKQILRIVKSLENIDLRSAKMNDSHLQNAFNLRPRFPNIKVLKLPHHRGLSTRCIYRIVIHCKNLSVLDVAFNAICNTCMRYFAQKLRQLRVLNVKNNKITDKGVRALTNARPPLESLNLAYSDNIRDRSATLISRSLTQLGSLDLSRSNITNDGVSDLASLPHLTKLILQNCYGINGNCAWSLDQAGCRISTLDLSYCKNISDSAVSNLARMRYPLPLTVFDVSWTTVSDHGVRSFAQGQHRIKDFSLRFCSNITDETLTIIGAEFPALRTLNVRNCRITTREGRDALRSCRPQLQLDWTE